MDSLNIPARLPQGGLYSFFRRVLGWYFLPKVNLNIDKQGIEKLQVPCIVLANHPSFIDWLYAAVAIYPVRSNMVIARYYYYNRKLAPLLSRLGAIPKDLFSPDYETIKKTMNVIKKGGCITLFPEGRLSPHGRIEAVSPATVKLLKKLNVPVYCMHLDGAYLTKPKWASDMRKGRIDLKLSLLFTPDELKTLTAEDTFAKLRDALSYDDWAWQKQARVAFKGKKLAEGLENLLYICPKCGAEFSLSSKGNRLTCEKCGNGAQFNEYYDLIPLDDSCVIPETVADWFELQKLTERRRIESDPEYGMTGHAVLRQPLCGKEWFTKVGGGTSSVSRAGFRFSGTRHNKPYVLEVPLGALPALPFGAGENYEVYDHGEYHYFVPDVPAHSVKWSVVADQLYRWHTENNS